MASIRKEISTKAGLEDVWAALRDVGALHTRLVPGFVADTRLESGAGIVTFGNGRRPRRRPRRPRRARSRRPAPAGSSWSAACRRRSQHHSAATIDVATDPKVISAIRHDQVSRPTTSSMSASARRARRCPSRSPRGLQVAGGPVHVGVDGDAGEARRTWPPGPPRRPRSPARRRRRGSARRPASGSARPRWLASPISGWWSSSDVGDVAEAHGRARPRPRSRRRRARSEVVIGETCWTPMRWFGRLDEAAGARGGRLDEAQRGDPQGVARSSR